MSLTGRTMQMRLMNFLFGRTSQFAALDQSQQARLQAVAQVAPPDMTRRVDKIRWVVCDVETSGLDVRSDQLIAIGAVAVTDGRIEIADSFEVVLHQPDISSDANILIHRIGGEAQRGGDDPREALLTFLEFVDGCPLVGFHASFDEAMLNRAAKHHLGYVTHHQWLDLAMLAPAMIPKANDADHSAVGQSRARARRPLDWWLDQYAVKVRKRHHAAADAMYTAQLWTVLLAAAPALGMGEAQKFTALARDYEWLIRSQLGSP